MSDLGLDIDITFIRNIISTIDEQCRGYRVEREMSAVLYVSETEGLLYSLRNSYIETRPLSFCSTMKVGAREKTVLQRRYGKSV